MWSFVVDRPGLSEREDRAQRRELQVIDASKMLWIEASSVASNSSSLCWAERPSANALEKLVDLCARRQTRFLWGLRASRKLFPRDQAA